MKTTNLSIVAACTMLVMTFVAPLGASAGVVPLNAGLMTPRFHHVAQALSDGTVLLAGGMPANGTVEASAELYDPAAHRFSSLPTMHSARVGAISAVLQNGNVLIAGGSDGHACLATAEIYDVTRRAFRAAASMKSPRCGAEGFVLHDGKVLIVGGSLSSDDHQEASAELYDPSADAFAFTGSMKVPRSSFAGAVLRDGKVLVTGGWSAGTYPHRTIEKSAEIYDPATQAFAITGSMQAERYKMAAIRLQDDRVLIIDGSDARDWRGTLDSTEIYEPSTGHFVTAAHMHSRRFKLPDGVALLDDGRVLVAGGADRPEIYSPTKDAFTPVDDAMLAGFYFSTVTHLPHDAVLIAGGYGEDPGAGAVNRAWIYRP